MESSFTPVPQRKREHSRSSRWFRRVPIERNVQDFASKLRAITDTELRSRSEDLRDLVSCGTPVLDESILVPGLGLMAEAVRRQKGLSVYNVQITAAVAMARNNIVEMQTGEGKTVSAALAAYLHALRNRGVHVVTSNVYLARRDRDILAPAFEALGLSCGFLPESSGAEEKRAAYVCDVTYGTGYEFGFDYLRDQVQLRRETAAIGRKCLANSDPRLESTVIRLQRGLWLTIIDEADNVLLDDACSPLLLSEAVGKTAPDAAVHNAARRVAIDLQPGIDFQADQSSGRVRLTSSGTAAVLGKSGEVPLHFLVRPWYDYVEQALRAECLFRRDFHYVVRDGEIRIVDSTTGRIFKDRKWSDGLHQAIEAKENLPTTPETQPMARITRQRFYGLYRNLAGLTGTAADGANELCDIYGTHVVPIPLRVPSRRQILPPRFFADATAKTRAIVAEVAEMHRAGRPVLVGTKAIAETNELSSQLAQQGIPHQVLNGMQDAEEAAIVAKAGAQGAVTISTNLAGRGTDVKLAPAAAASGGLHVVLSGRHESRRIDRQLIGRGARQGDPGSARTFCAGDDWLVKTSSPWIAAALARHADHTGEARLDFSPAFDRAQRIVDRQQTLVRRDLFQTDKRRDEIMARIEGMAESA